MQQSVKPLASDDSTYFKVRARYMMPCGQVARLQRIEEVTPGRPEATFAYDNASGGRAQGVPDTVALARPNWHLAVRLA
jgi:hypothetical protein